MHIISLFTLAWVMMSAHPTTAADDGTEGRDEPTNKRHLRTLEEENDHLREQLQIAKKNLSQRAHYTKELESKLSDLLRSLRKKSSITQIKARIAILESLLKEHHPRWDFENDTSSGDESIHTDSDESLIH